MTQAEALAAIDRCLANRTPEKLAEAHADKMDHYPWSRKLYAEMLANDRYPWHEQIALRNCYKKVGNL